MSVRTRRLLLAACTAVLALVTADRLLALLSERCLWERLAPTERSPPPPPPPPQPKLVRYDPVVGYVLKPNLDVVHEHSAFSVTIRTNDQGLRDEPVPTACADDEYRILALGDSFTFGWGVEPEQTFVEQLGALLSGPRKKLSVINAGVPGWSPDHAWLWLQQGGLDYEVDLVLYQVSVNDIADLSGDALLLGEDGLVIANQGPFGTDDVGQLRSVLQRMAVPDPDTALQKIKRGVADPTLAFALKKTVEARREVAPDPDRPFDELTPLEIARALRVHPSRCLDYLLVLLEAMQAACASRGVPLRFVLVTCPVQESSEPALVARLQQWFAEHRTGAMDMSRRYSFAVERGDYFVGDPHWTSRVHADAARHLARWLADDPVLELALVDER